MTSPDDVDVDARFLLANERTLLAWVRTSLTLLAAGVGTLQLIADEWRTGPGLGLLLLGAVAAFVGLARYRSADSAIRRGQLPPVGRGPTLVAAAVGVAAVALTVLSATSSAF
jgi:putative membrane protein